MKKNNVFVIGLPKTGTTSLEKALKKLGYKVCSWRFLNRNNLLPKSLDPEDSEHLYKLIGKKFNAVQDTPWPYLWKELDRRFPQSKFILTMRESADTWVKSAAFYFKDEDEIYRRIYFGGGKENLGIVTGHENIYKKKYNKHNNEIIEYFKNRPQDLLVFNIQDGNDKNKWEKLCGFLNKRIPRRPFPHRKKRINKDELT